LALTNQDIEPDLRARLIATRARPRDLDFEAYGAGAGAAARFAARFAMHARVFISVTSNNDQTMRMVLCMFPPHTHAFTR
jgi:hypothetical protein